MSSRIDPRLDLVLDDALERYLNGESSEDCAMRYPAFAVQVRTYLEVPERFTTVLAERPAAGAKDRARIRMLGEWNIIKEERRRHSRRGIIQPAFLTAAAAAIVLLLGTLSIGPGLVNWPPSLDREPVNGTEHTAEALQEWADDHIRTAESHATSLAQLIAEGRASEAAERARDLAVDVASTLASAAALPDAEDTSRFYGMLRASATELLAELQHLVETAPTEARMAAVEALRITGVAYAEVFESSASASGGNDQAAEGVLRIELAPVAPANVEGLQLEVGLIEVRLAGPDDEWATLTGGPFVATLNGPILPPRAFQGHLPSGQYTRVRLHLSSGRLSSGEAVQVPPYIEAIRPFGVPEEDEVNVVLDLGSLVLEPLDVGGYRLAGTAGALLLKP